MERSDLPFCGPSVSKPSENCIGKWKYMEMVGAHDNHGKPSAYVCQIGMILRYSEPQTIQIKESSPTPNVAAWLMIVSRRNKISFSTVVKHCLHRFKTLKS